jgi:hypothetical protein
MKFPRAGRIVKNRVTLVVGLGAIVCLLTAWQADAVKAAKKNRPMSIKGLVSDTHGRPLAGATVYFVDSALIDTTPITPAAILSGAAESYDEPLEDIINDATKVESLPKAKTDKKGKFSAKKLDGSKTYFAFVQPAATDLEHLPGGDASRIAFTPKAIGKAGLQIQMSWQIPTGATHIGSTACYVCHGPGTERDVTSNKRHGHALSFKRMGVDTGLQDSENHPGASWNELEKKFTLATAYNKPVAPATSVETLYFQDYDASSSNKFVIYENTKGTSTVYIKMYLWKTAGGVYNLTLENVITPADPNNFVTFTVPMVMGGYIRQALVVNPTGLKGLYKILSYQAMKGSSSQGQQSNYDRSRKPFAEAGSGPGGFADFFNPTTKLIKIPTSATRNVSCATCHYGSGTHELFTDGTTGETLAHTVSDPNGQYALGGDGSLQEMSISCEECHGPGSKHREAALLSITQPSEGKKVEDTTGKYIINPSLLGADRASLICGRCHQNRGILIDEEELPPLGISRKEYLAKYVVATNKTSTTANRWTDGVHERGGHHSFTYTNYMISKHAKNSRQLVACDDCHDAMGDSPYRYGLKGDPDNSETGLCLNCHAVDVNTHVPEKTGSQMSGAGMNCIDCHMTRTGKGGAGRPGLLLGTPTGVSTDANITYWEGDQSSHVFDVPNKFTAGVAGAVPGSAMPTPYTNSCGTCHDASKLQYQVPSNVLGQ